MGRSSVSYWFFLHHINKSFIIHFTHGTSCSHDEKGDNSIVANSLQLYHRGALCI